MSGHSTFYFFVNVEALDQRQSEDRAGSKTTGAADVETAFKALPVVLEERAVDPLRALVSSFDASFYFTSWRANLQTFGIGRIDRKVGLCRGT